MAKPRKKGTHNNVRKSYSLDLSTIERIEYHADRTSVGSLSAMLRLMVSEYDALHSSRGPLDPDALNHFVAGK